eukprot:1187337-Prorocentrum_minimum.AAC.3
MRTLKSPLKTERCARSDHQTGSPEYSGIQRRAVSAKKTVGSISTRRTARSMTVQADSTTMTYINVPEARPLVFCHASASALCGRKNNELMQSARAPSWCAAGLAGKPLRAEVWYQPIGSASLPPSKRGDPPRDFQCESRSPLEAPGVTQDYSREFRGWMFVVP